MAVTNNVRVLRSARVCGVVLIPSGRYSSGRRSNIRDAALPVGITAARIRWAAITDEAARASESWTPLWHAGGLRIVYEYTDIRAGRWLAVRTRELIVVGSIQKYIKIIAAGSEVHEGIG